MLEKKPLMPSDYKDRYAYEGALANAIRSNDPDEFARFKAHIPWGDIECGDFLRYAVDTSIHGTDALKNSAADHGLALFVDYAIEQGQSANLGARADDAEYGNQDKVIYYPEPIASIILGGYGELLRRYLDYGFNPLVAYAYDGGTCNAVEFAEYANCHSMVDLMRAHRSRDLVEGLLAPAPPAAAGRNVSSGLRG